MKPHSEDLRWRAVRAVEGEMSRREAARVFEVSLPAIKRDALPEALPARLVEHADATLAEHRSWWRERSGVEVSTATMSRAIAASAWTRKRRP
jgi:hypothetical protein